MNLREYQSDFSSVLEVVGEHLGAKVRPFQMAWSVEQMLTRQLRPTGRVGFGSKYAIDLLTEGRPGNELAIGFQSYRLKLDEGDIFLADVILPQSLPIPSIWVVAVDDYRRLYREVRKLIRKSHTQYDEPFMPAEDRQRLWDNTIGFLKRDHSQMRHFDIPVKRGVLLTGEPGNGKTMACRWLSAQCHNLGLEWESVTMDDYDRARRDGTMHDLFQPSGPGVVVFDDFDSALRDRDSCDNVRDQNTFLTEMDGLTPREHVVYIFTSNLKVNELDSALRRPGRIDQFVHFPKPDAKARREFIRSRWQDEIRKGLDLNRVIDETEGLSFAEIEELRKLLVLRFLDTNQVEWGWARKLFGERSTSGRSQRRIGFNSASEAIALPTNDVAAVATN